MRVLLVIFIFLSQWVQASRSDSTELLIADMTVQIEATEAMNAMYNYDFKEARKQYNWLMQKYPDSPLSYFLLGLSEWWKMIPDSDVDAFDDEFHYYMDTAILIAERMLEIPDKRIEGAFFLAASYAFKGRLYSDRGQWGRAASAGKSSLKYLEISKEHSYLSPELLFGDALYNYFSVWIPENYPILKPVLAFFPDGDKALGIKQLQEVSANAFYTRIEAQIFLMQILANDEHDYRSALRISEYLHQHYPNNPYFHRYYARYLYSNHLYRDLEPVALQIIERIDAGWFGYEGTSGRYAAFFLGQLYQSKGDIANSKKFYHRTIEFSEGTEDETAGYNLYAMLGLGRLAQAQGEEDEAKDYYKGVKKLASRKDSAYEEANRLLKTLKKKD